MILAIDWSHTKDLAIYDGKKFRVETREALLKRLAGESNEVIKSRHDFKPASLIILMQP